MRSRASHRRQLSRLRAAFANQPLALDIRALGEFQTALGENDLSGVKLALSFGGDEIPTATRIVDGVAVIPVTGVLRDEADFMVRYYGCGCYQVIERDFDAALNNSSVKAVAFWFNTPGGQAIGAKRTADRIFESRGEKPVVAYVQNVCGSAGYYLASACDRIEATSDAMIGSIGTIYNHQEISGMAKEMGVGFTVFTNEGSPKKGHGNLYEPLSDAAKNTLQNFVDSFGGQFIESVARYRGTSAENVIKNYGQGDAFVGTEAKRRGMVDAIVPDFSAVLQTLTTANDQTPVQTSETETTGSPPTESRAQTSPRSIPVKKIKAQLFALGLIDSLDVSDEICKGILAAWFASRGESVPADEAAQLKAIQSGAAKPQAATATATVPAPAPVAATNPVQQAHDREQEEARAAAKAENKATLEDLQASAKLINEVSGSETITDAMVLEALKAGMDSRAAVKSWSEAALSKKEKPVATTRVNVTGEGAARYATDIVDALMYRATSQGSRRRGRDGAASGSGVKPPALSEGAASLVNRPIWAVAGECLQIAGIHVDMYGDRELICRQAMEMATPNAHQGFYSTHEGRQYVGSTATIPFTRPGDFPNILSNLANKFLDSIEMDEWTYDEFTAVWPTGFGDFKPAVMINTGTPDELDEILDSGTFNELKKAEEVLSYIFCRRFGNKWGWTPVLLANDDMGAFAEGMLGLDEAWETTQHRLCLALLTGNPTLLDGNALFSARSQGDNDREAGAAPSDTEWAAMEELYADIKGVGTTTRRVRGALDTLLTPTGVQYQAARRTFLPLNAGGLEGKVATTTDNVGLYRGLIKIIPEPELRDSSVPTRYYGLRQPTKLRTATIVRGYFNGFGTGGRRERWYDPETKTTWVSIEGRIGVAVKNWRYAVRNKGAA